ncbi:MAG TPA: hypothetical protein VFA46_03165 [Actinomycetes bacterium]|nr:hypothetical protein [Actinomycetes bacterium]
MDAPFLALVWRPGGLRLVELPPTGASGKVTERWQGRAPGAFGPGRRDLGLWRAGQRVIVRFPGDPQMPALRSPDGGRTFAPVPPVPGGQSAPLAGCRAHWNGSVTVLEGELMPEVRTVPQVLHRLLPDAGSWDSVELPEAFNAWSVSVLGSGEPLLGGSWRTPEGGRSALLRLTPSGTQMIVPPYVRSPGWLWWLRTLLSEQIDEQFSRVDAAEEPWVLEQVHGPLETDHSVLHLATGRRWRILRLWRDSATVWLRPRPGAVRLVMSQGVLRDTPDGGRSWVRHDLMPAARPLLRARSDWSLRVSSAAQHGDDLVVVFTAEDWSQPEAEQLFQTSVLHTCDNGRTARELLRTEGPEQAVIAVA